MQIRYLLTVLLLLAPCAASAQPAVVAASVNGVLNPTQFSGSDIGAKVNTAFQSGMGKTVRVPAGSYTFSTPMVIPGSGYKLECDAGAVLTFNPSTSGQDAITLTTNAAGNQNVGIDGSGGCQLIDANGIARSGINIPPSNFTFVRNMSISGFTGGSAILVSGGNSVDISGNDIHNNQTGVILDAGSNNYPANAVHISHNEISSNTAWGIDSHLDPSGCACTENLGDTITENVLEGNGLGDVNLNWNRAARVQGNYFESSGIAVQIGATTNSWGIAVVSNYFTTSSSVTEAVSIGYGVQFDISDNAEDGTGTQTGCFINITTGNNGGSFGHRGIGTNLLSGTANEWCNHGTATSNP